MSKPPSLWLRAENKPWEARSAVAPEDAAKLLAKGFQVTVEESPGCAFATREYRSAGCQITAAGAWRDAPEDCFIVGLKELPDDDSLLRHRHIYFAHAYKNQQGWRKLLDRFRRGGGQLLDLEYLQDEKGRRVAAFGYWAGFVGAALAVLTWSGQKLERTPALGPLTAWHGRDMLLQACAGSLEQALPFAQRRPELIVIGAGGRVGSGALDLATALSLAASPWDLAETNAGGPFPEIIAHDIFVNCVLVGEKTPPFIDFPLVDDSARRLSVVADVSCDPYGDYNPVPLYNACTSTAAPTIRVREAECPLDLIAIDNLPSLLPRESSEDFSAQLLPTLLQLDGDESGVWRNNANLFNHFCSHKSNKKG